MSLTVFAGTFNPVHIAHLIIAETVRNELGLDKILFIPAFCPPHRDSGLASPADRLNMVKLAIQDNPYFEVSDIEFHRKNKSYSYITVHELKNKLNISEKINFIIGSDAFSLIDTWYEVDKLAELVNFVIVARPELTELEKLFGNIMLREFSYKIVKAPLLDISSSYIRKLIGSGKSIKYLVPKSVEEYIYNNNLYA